MSEKAKKMLEELQKKYGDKKFKLPNGVELSVNQYITEYFSIFFDIDVVSHITLNENVRISMMQFLEEFILSECQQKYNGDIIDLVIEKLDDDSIKNMIKNLKNKEIQSQLLSKNISDDIKYYCFEYFDKKVCEDYLSLNPDFARRIVSNFGFMNNLLAKDIIIPSTIIDDEFFDDLISSLNSDGVANSTFISSKIQWLRNYINALSRICDVSYLEKKLDIFYGNYINLYKDYENTIKNLNLNSNKIPLPQNLLFVEDFVEEINYFNSLLEEYEKYKGTPFAEFSKRNLDKHKESTLQLLEDKLDNVLIDNLFKENIINVRINLNEIVSYNNYLSDDEKLVDDNTLNFYKMIINIKKLGSDQKLDLYNKFKGKNIPILYYDDLRKCKNDSYKRLKDSLMNIDNYKPNKKLSDKYGSVVYDMRDEKYIMLVRCLDDEWYEGESFYNESFSVISNDYTHTHRDRDKNREPYIRLKDAIAWPDVSEQWDMSSSEYRKDPIIYGYSNIDINRINHVYDGDSNSVSTSHKRNVDGSYSAVTDRLLLPKHLAHEVNIFSAVKGNKFSSLKPSYIICKDEIDGKSLLASKHQNLPIVLIKAKKIRKANRHDYAAGVVPLYNIDSNLSNLIELNRYDNYLNESLNKRR